MGRRNNTLNIAADDYGTIIMDTQFTPFDSN